MKYKNPLFLFLIFILALPMVLSYGSYQNAGSPNETYSTTTPSKLASLLQYTVNGVSNQEVLLSNTVGMPLIADINNDSLPEVVVANKPTISIFQNTSMVLLNSFLFDGESSTSWSQPVIQDLNSDGLKEIIFITSNRKIYILTMYGNGTLSNNTLTASAASSDTGQNSFYLYCNQNSNCLALIGHNQLGFYDSWSADAIMFNDSAIINQTNNFLRANSAQIATSGADFGGFPSMPVVAFDENSYPVITYSTSHKGVSGLLSTGYPCSYAATVSGNSVHTVKLQMNATAPSIKSSNCSTISLGTNYNLKPNFTSPYVQDIDGSLGNGREIVIASTDGANTFKMVSLRSDFSALRTYPNYPIGSPTSGNGRYLSNIVSASAFSNSQTLKDFCVAGYNDDPTQARIDFMCGTETGYALTPGILRFRVNTQEFLTQLQTMPDSTNFNMTNTNSQTAWRQSIHSTKYINAPSVVSGSCGASNAQRQPYSSFLTPYGLFQVDVCASPFDISGWTSSIINYNMYRIAVPVIQPSYPNATYVPVDFKGMGYDTWFALDLNGIHYINDNFVYSPAQILDYQIDPCIEKVWKTNTSYTVNVWVSDTNGLQTEANVTLDYMDGYVYGHNWSGLRQQNISLPFNGVANHTTTGVGLLLLTGRNSQNVTPFATVNLSFSVADDGEVTKGDSSHCITKVHVTPTTQPCLNCVTTTTYTIGQTFAALADILGWTSIIMWIMLMAGAAVFMAYLSHSGGWHGSTTIYLLVGVEFFMLLLGWLLGIIGNVVILVITIFGLLFIGLWVSRKLSGQSEAGD